MHRTAKKGFCAAAAVMALLASPLAAEEPGTAFVEGNRGTSLQGSARLSRNRPVVGASVRIRSEESRSRYLLTSTDGAGIFRTLELPDGEYRVTLGKPGLASVAKESVAVRSPFRPVVEIDMGPGDAEPPTGGDGGAGGLPVPVTGRILDLAGRPVADVPVRLVRVDGSEDPVRFRSDDGGVLHGGPVSPGLWNVEVLGIGFLSIRTVLQVDGPVELTALLVPRPPGYRAPAIDLLPEERPAPPAGFTPAP